MRLRNGQESGSAAVEFVLLAIPLFLPIFIYLVHFSDLSGSEISAHTLVREIVRAYVSGDDDANAKQRSGVVMAYAARRLGFSPEEISSMHLSFECSAQPCFTAGEKVKATLEFRTDLEKRLVNVAAWGYISPWQ